MKRQNYFLVWAVLFGFLSFISCTNDPITEDVPQLDNLSGETQKELVGIPYAKESDLQAFSSDDEIVDYNFSREVALIDLQDFKKDIYQDKGNLTLSELPVIVYDNDNKPKFYEFIVSDNDKEVGTITCFAKKEVPGFTAYVLPFVRNYNEKNSTKYSEVYPYSSTQVNTSSVTARKALSEEELKIQQEAKDFWANVKSKEELKNLTAPNKTARFIDAWNEYHTIPQFNNNALLKTHWSGACGPAALAWLYRAYNTHYKGKYYPLHGGYSWELNFGKILDVDASSYFRGENPLYKDLAEICRVGYGVDPFKAVTLPEDLKRAANAIFPNHKLEGGFPIAIGKARRSIENNNPTVLLIRSGIELHYVVGFGTKNRYNTYNLWLFKVRKVHTDSWVYVSDNGATTSSNGYMPYYMNTHAILGKDFVTFTLYRK